MSLDECVHGLERVGCSACGGGGVATVPASPARNRSKQRLYDDLCNVLGVAPYAVTPGSSPVRVFAAAAARADVQPGSMPAIGAAIAAKAGLTWGPDYDNRRHQREATAVTTEGVAVITQALGILAKR